MTYADNMAGTRPRVPEVQVTWVTPAIFGLTAILCCLPFRTPLARPGLSAAAAVGFALLASVFWRRRWPVSRFYLSLEFVAIWITVWASNGIRSPVVLLFLVFVLETSVAYGGWLGAISATMASASMLVSQPFLATFLPEDLSRILACCPFFLLAGILSSLLVDQASNERWQRHSQQRMLQEIIRAQRETQAQTRIASSLTSSSGRDHALSTIARTVAGAVESAACAVILLDKAGTPQPAGTWNVSWDLAGLLLASQAMGIDTATTVAVRTREAQVHRQVAQILDERLAPFRPGIEAAGIHLCISMPLVYQDSITGALNCYYANDHAVDDRELEFLRGIADQTALAVENARLLTEVQKTAALEERQRLARELHDSVSQTVYGITLGARTARRALGTDAREVDEALQYTLKLADGALAELRALIFELRPEALERDGLVLSLSRQLTVMSTQHGFHVENDLGQEPLLAVDTREALYRVAREALSNVVKHSQATKVTVAMMRRGTMLVLSVTDDGIGFDAHCSFPGHLGIVSMQERMQGIGGRLDLYSAGGEGTRLEAVTPLLED